MTDWYAKFQELEQAVSKDDLDGSPYFVTRNLIALFVEAVRSKTVAPGDELPLRCAFERGAISISVGEKALAHATNINPALYDDEKDRGTFQVTNNAVFAEEVVRELNREREDGSTMLTDTLDKAVYEAINQGAEGVEEVK